MHALKNNTDAHLQAHSKSALAGQTGECKRQSESVTQERGYLFSNPIRLLIVKWLTHTNTPKMGHTLNSNTHSVCLFTKTDRQGYLHRSSTRSVQCCSDRELRYVE